MGVDVLGALDATAVLRWAERTSQSFAAHRAELDRLNVFPVHDSDTGANLATTMAAAVGGLRGHPGAPADAAEALQVLARAAVVGACGNSGNIVAQLLRGLADAAATARAGGTGSVDGPTLRAGLELGCVQARAAVADPVEGTILTVAEAAAAAVPAGAVSIAEVAGVALAAADEALRRTPEQLPVLARAGVVDAGGLGYVLLLEALVETICGPGPDMGPVPTGVVAALDDRHTGAPADDAFEVQFLIGAAPGLDADALRTRLAGVGDSVVVVGTGDGTWSVHVHTDDIGAALEAGLDHGRPHRVTVTSLSRPGAAAETDAVIAIAPGDGLTDLFGAEGVPVVAGPQPSVHDIVQAIRATAATRIVLLAMRGPAAVAAEEAATRMRRPDRRVAVVPARSPVQMLAAVAVHDPGRRFDDGVVAMAEAAAATRFAEIVVAEHESLTAAGVCQAGDVLGLIDGEVVAIGRGVLSVALTVVDRLLGVGVELMTLLVGADAQPGTGDVIRRHVRDRSDLTEVGVYDVGQPGCPLIIGVE